MLLFFTCLLAWNGFGQELAIEVGYRCIENQQFDKSIQVYNQSRPFLSKKQALFRSGWGVKVAYYKSLKTTKFSFGGEMDYGNFESYTENVDFINDLQLHTLTPRFFSRYSLQKALSCQFNFGIPLYGIFRQINGESVTNDGSTVKALGFGISIGPEFNYRIAFKNGLALEPTVGLEYCPVQFSPQGESVLNQTKGLYTSNFTSFVLFEAGVKFCFPPKKAKKETISTP